MTGTKLRQRALSGDAINFLQTTPGGAAFCVPDEDGGVPRRGWKGLEMAGSLMTAAEVAHLLGVPVSWVYEQSRRGRIPTVTLGRYRRYRRDAIEEWIGELERTSGPRSTRGLV